MRIVLAALLLTTVGSVFGTANADSYRWCADYGGNGYGGATNCGFVTMQQCQWAVSGNGGWCRPNPFYAGAPTSGYFAVHRGKKRSRG